MQGIGGIEAIARDGKVIGLVNDYFGNVVVWQDGAATRWTTSRVGGYGALPGSVVLPLSPDQHLEEVINWLGKRQEHIELIWLGDRYYDPQTGRFMSPDSIGHLASPSLYDYCYGDPVNFVDPDGRCLEKAKQNTAWFGNQVGQGLQNVADGTGATLPSIKSDIGSLVDQGRVDPISGGVARFGLWVGGAAADLPLTGAYYQNASEALGTLDPRVVIGAGIKAYGNQVVSNFSAFSNRPSFSSFYDIAENSADLYVLYKGTGTLVREVKSGVVKIATRPRNPVPTMMARVIAGDGPFPMLGLPNAKDVFVTAAEDIAGLDAAQLAKRLSIDTSVVFTVIKFPTPLEGVASPINRSYRRFVGKGRTAGKAREFVIPNQPVPRGAVVEVVK